MAAGLSRRSNTAINVAVRPVSWFATKREYQRAREHDELKVEEYGGARRCCPTWIRRQARLVEDALDKLPIPCRGSKALPSRASVQAPVSCLRSGQLLTNLIWVFTDEYQHPRPLKPSRIRIIALLGLRGGDAVCECPGRATIFCGRRASAYVLRRAPLGQHW